MVTESRFRVGTALAVFGIFALQRFGVPAALSGPAVVVVVGVMFGKPRTAMDGVRLLTLAGALGVFLFVLFGV